MLPMLNTGHDLSLGRPIAAQLVGDQEAVTAHPTLAIGVLGKFAASTKRMASNTECVPACKIGLARKFSWWSARRAVMSSHGGYAAA
jgi:hypothetical protein